MDTQNNDKRIILGTILIAVGLVTAFANFNVFPYWLEDIVFSWQMLLIAIGSAMLLSKRNRIVGIVLISVGGFFIVPEIFDINIRFRQIFWPLILVVIGVALIFRKEGMSHLNAAFSGRPADDSSDPDVIDDMVIFSGNKRNVFSQNFKGGKVTSVFGGSQFNFNDARLSPNGATLDVFTVFGGTTFYVPSGWNVQIEVVSIFGSFSDKRKYLPNTITDLNKTLYIKGVTIFGGGEVRNHNII